ncbi:MAG: general secretion pathway protein GspB [Gammaproteobacteria bacterium]
MSYILAALKKSEQERELGRVPGLVTSQELKPAPRPRWVWAVVGVLLINGLLLSGLFMQQRMSEKTIRVSEIDAITDPGTGVTTNPTDKLKQLEEPQVVVKLDPKSVAVPVPTPPAIEATVAADSPGARESVVKKAPSPTVITPASPEVKQRATVVFAQQPLDQLSDVEQIFETLSSARGSDQARAEQIPLWRELPADIRQSLPLISLDVHVYTEQASDRFVLINLLRYKEGDVLEEGPRVERITPEGMVLFYQGERFRITK